MKAPRELAPLLREVASDTGKPFHAVERVFKISLQAFAKGFTLQVVGGQLNAVPHAASSELPTDLTGQINRHYSDFFDLADPIERVVRQITMGDITGKAASADFG
jgi:hypothetical protein